MRIRTLTTAAAATLVTGSLFATAAGAAPASTASTARAEAVVVQDIQIPVPGQRPVRAYLVRPARAHAAAGVLYLHWLEPPALNQNRTEFLAEAVEVAGHGAIALLPDLTFPWDGNVVGDVRDARSVTAQLDAITRVYRTLLAQPGLDRSRVAVVGHDYGAMFGALLAQREPTVRAQVFMAGDATWSNWFARFFLGVPNTPQYNALFAGLDPVDNVRRLGPHLYLQWAGEDFFIPAEIHDRFAAANPAAKVSVYAGHDHTLDDLRVHDDRTAWLLDELRLA